MNKQTSWATDNFCRKKKWAESNWSSNWLKWFDALLIISCQLLHIFNFHVHHFIFTSFPLRLLYYHRQFNSFEDNEPTFWWYTISWFESIRKRQTTILFVYFFFLSTTKKNRNFYRCPNFAPHKINKTNLYNNILPFNHAQLNTNYDNARWLNILIYYFDCTFDLTHFRWLD